MLASNLTSACETQLDVEFIFFFFVPLRCTFRSTSFSTPKETRGLKIDKEGGKEEASATFKNNSLPRQTKGAIRAKKEREGSSMGNSFFFFLGLAGCVSGGSDGSHRNRSGMRLYSS